MLRDQGFRVFRPAEQLVEGRQGCRDLERFVHGFTYAREKRIGAAAIAAIEESRGIIGGEAVCIGLPSGGARGHCWFPENPFKLLAGLPEFIEHLVAAHLHEPVLPANVIVAMDAGFVAAFLDRAHDSLIAPAHLRPRQEHAVQQRSEPVGRDHAGSAHFAQKSRTEDAFNGAAGIVRAEGKKERGPDAELVKEGGKIRHAEAGAPVGVDVNFNGKKGM